MTTLSCALALLSGIIGAGFASGQEIAAFFAAHGPYAPLSVLCACAMLAFLFYRLPAVMQRLRCADLPSLCRARFGERFGRLCAALFTLLCAVTGGAMLCACAELAALTLPIRGAYPLGLIVSLCLSWMLCARGLRGLSMAGAVLCALLPLLLIRLLHLPTGEAAFSPASPLLHAALSGVSYGALNAAMLLGASPLLLPARPRQRAGCILLFIILLGALLALGAAVLGRHRQVVARRALPFVYLCNQLGKGGYLLCALTLYAASLSTLCAMLAALSQLLPGKGRLAAALLCLLLALTGFEGIVTRGYPVLGALCAALTGLLCLPVQNASSSSR